jgi:hypothetical protein
MDFFRCAAARVVAVEVTAHSLGDGGFTRLVQALPRLSLTLSLSLPLSLSHPLSLHAARAGAAPAVSHSLSLSLSLFLSLTLFLFTRLVQALPRLSLPLSLSHPSFSLSSLFLFSRLVQALPRLSLPLSLSHPSFSSRGSCRRCPGFARCTRSCCATTTWAPRVCAATHPSERCHCVKTSSFRDQLKFKTTSIPKTCI